MGWRPIALLACALLAAVVGAARAAEVIITPTEINTCSNSSKNKDKVNAFCCLLGPLLRHTALRLSRLSCKADARRQCVPCTCCNTLIIRHPDSCRYRYLCTDFPGADLCKSSSNWLWSGQCLLFCIITGIRASRGINGVWRCCCRIHWRIVLRSRPHGHHILHGNTSLAWLLRLCSVPVSRTVKTALVTACYVKTLSQRQQLHAEHQS